MAGEEIERIKVVELSTFMTKSAIALLEEGLLPSELLLFQAGESGLYFLPNDNPEEISVPTEVVILRPKAIDLSND